MSLQNFAKARESMVVSQLHPSGIAEGAVSDAFLATPREMFAPNILRGVSYLDDDIPLGSNGRFLMEPLILAKMLQDAEVSEHSKVLDIGGGTGYSAAVLARLAGEVVALDCDEKLLHTARLNWDNLGLQTIISPVLGNHPDGYATGAPYDVIIVNGAVGEPPLSLLEQLKKGGRLYCVLRFAGEPIGEIVAFGKGSHDGQVTRKILSDASAPYLKGFAPEEKFEF